MALRLAVCSLLHGRLHYVYTRISHCEKKLARLLFDFDVIITTDADCEQQVPSVALFTTVDNTGGETTVWSVDNSCSLTRAKVERKDVLIPAHILYLTAEYPGLGGPKSGKRIKMTTS